MHANQLVALCHHFYNGADSASMRSIAAAFPNAVKFQTEFLINEGMSGKTWFEYAQIMQLSLVEEGVSMFNLFALAYRAASTHCFFSLDSIGPVYTVRPIYYAFKHFSKSIHRGWRQVGATVDKAGLKISAFSDPSGDSLAVVVINKDTTATTLSLSLPNQTSEAAIYQTTETKKYAPQGNFSGSGAITLDARSITTVEAPPQLIKNKTVSQTKRSMIRPALLRTFRRGSGSICALFKIPSSSAYRLSLFDMSGRKISSYAFKGGDHNGVSTHLFEGRTAEGVYIVNLECNGYICNSTIVVVR